MAKNQKQQRKRPAYEENDVPWTSNLNHHPDGKDAAQKPHTHAAAHAQDPENEEAGQGLPRGAAADSDHLSFSFAEF